MKKQLLNAQTCNFAADNGKQCRVEHRDLVSVRQLDRRHVGRLGLIPAGRSPAPRRTPPPPPGLCLQAPLPTLAGETPHPRAWSHGQAVLVSPESLITLSLKLHR